jgi:hypothetical protein
MLLYLCLVFDTEDGGDVLVQNVVDIGRSTQCYVAENSTLPIYRCDNQILHRIISLMGTVGNFRPAKRLLASPGARSYITSV